MTIAQLKRLKETENKVEFKEAKGGNFSYNGGSRVAPNERRRCMLGYVTAFANEGGGHLVLGVHDKHPHDVVGTLQCTGAVGKLEQDVYRDTKIRITATELFDETGRRVLLITVPARPHGKVFKFEDVALMRVGEELLPMSDAHYLKIIQEQEPDFSERICEGLRFEDLDEMAVRQLMQAYATKQDNNQFLTLPPLQALQDLSLMRADKVTYAALVLVGKQTALREHLPQSSIALEYRQGGSQITFDNRLFFYEPYFVAVERLWSVINQRNGNVPVQRGPYIFDIPFFNKEVVREAINNAVAHRDYRKSSEVVIKQFPTELHIINPGGFPLGVTLENLLVTNSTPRNRLLCDVMAKTGVVERSGQGIDKIYYQSLAESKPEPDYTRSDDFQVELRLSALVEDKAFALFIKQTQQARRPDERLSVQEVIALNKIRKGESIKQFDLGVVRKLEKEGLIERLGKTNSQRFILSKEYFVFIDKKGAYSAEKSLEQNHLVFLVIQHLKEFGVAKMGDFQTLLNKFLSRDQVKYLINQLLKDGLLEREGQLKGTVYKASKKMQDGEKLASRAFELGVEEMKKRGEIPDA